MTDPKASSEAKKLLETIRSSKWAEEKRQREFEDQAKYLDAAIAGVSSYMMKESSPPNPPGRVVLDEIVRMRQGREADIQRSQETVKSLDREYTRIDLLDDELEERERKEKRKAALDDEEND